MGVPRVFVPFHLDEHRPDLEADLPVPPGITVLPALPEGADPWGRYGALHDAVADAVAAALEGSRTVDVVSGDCLIAVGVVAGVQRAGIDPAVVWLDAHGDVQTVQTSASGYPGGMPVRILAGYRPPGYVAPRGLRPVAEERLALVGARDLDPPEVEYLAQAAVHRLDVAALDADAVPPGPLVLHVDLDVVDPSDLPGMGFPAPGGPPADDVVAAVARVLATGRVLAFSVAATWPAGPGADVPQRARLLAALLRAR
jgi:arginase